MVKAIFFDIDGTLVPYGLGHIPEEVCRAIAEVRKKGIKVFISTGRHIEWVDNVDDAEFDGYVTANGSICLLADKKTRIHLHCIDPSDIKRLAEFCKTSDMSIAVIPANGGLFLTSTNELVDKACEGLKIPDIPINTVESALDKDIVQLMSFASPEDRIKSGLLTDILTHCQATSWNPLFCDIVSKGSDKGIGIRKMADYFNIPIEDTVAFGDGTNDIEMLSTAGIGIAMGNAPDEVKSAADYVTDHIDSHGVINAFRHLGIL